MYNSFLQVFLRISVTFLHHPIITLVPMYDYENNAAEYLVPEYTFTQTSSPWARSVLCRRRRWRQRWWCFHSTTEILWTLSIGTFLRHSCTRKRNNAPCNFPLSKDAHLLYSSLLLYWCRINNRGLDTLNQISYYFSRDTGAKYFLILHNLQWK